MGSYVYVTGTSVNDYKVDSFIPFTGNWRSPKTGVTITGSPGSLYNDKIYPGDNGWVASRTQESLDYNDQFRKDQSMWYLDIIDLNKNANGEDLEFLQFDHSVDNFYETGKTKILTVERVQYYVDQDLDSVKEQLKSTLIYEKDTRINVPYNFKSKDGKINLDFNMSQDARYNIRDAYYLQQDMKSSDIAFFIENTPIRLPKKYIKELFLEVNEFIYNILVELERQTFNVESTDNIYDAQLSAEWVYAGREVPERIMS